MNHTNKSYFIFSLIIMLPAGLASALFNNITLTVMASIFTDYPQIVHVAMYTPDRFLVTLHLLGYKGLLGILIILLSVITVLTFLFKIKQSNIINSILYTVGTLFFIITLVWYLRPMIVMAR